MNRIVFTLLFLPQIVYSQYQADVFSLDLSKPATQLRIGQTFLQDTTLYLSERVVVTGFSFSGKSVLFNNNDSYIRLTLTDDTDYEYLVYENFPILSDELTTTFSNNALETILLNRITPKKLKIIVNKASLEIKSIYYSVASDENNCYSRKLVEIQKKQAEYIVNKLNTNLEKRNMTWRAALTSMSEKTFSEKKEMFGGSVPELFGFEYYASGVFVLPTDENYSNRTTRNVTSNSFVPEWDWRNRHGKNWITPVRDQLLCGGCWAFAALGAIESYVNLYYNQILNFNLSEQELISCAVTNGCSGGGAGTAMSYANSYGVVDENCMQYASYAINCDTKCENPSEKVFIGGSGHVIVNVDSIKKQLIISPTTISISSWPHALTLIGYKQAEIGDSIMVALAGQIEKWIKIDSTNISWFPNETFWLVKNSWGTEWGDHGYAYISLNINSIGMPFYPKGMVSCLSHNTSDIVCEDADGDGLYYWGVGPKPAHCPSWVPDSADGDDSNINYGCLDDFGNLEELPEGITINTPIAYTSNNTTSYRLGIVSGGTLTITGTTTLSGNSKIRVCEGGTLIVDGGNLLNADIALVPGSQVIVRNNGVIAMAAGKIFEAPTGVVVSIESGEIR